MIDFNESDLIPLETSQTDLATRQRAERADAVANRHLILATAQQLFTEHGIANVCMTTIAEAAGVGKGTLYRRFANKGELCLALMDDDMRAFQNEILQMLKETYHQPALSRLDLFLKKLVYFMDFHAPLLREVQRHGGLQSVSDTPQISSPHMWLPWLRTTVGVLLRQAEQNGETRDLDIPYLVDAILAPLSANLFMYQREILGLDLERISRGIRRLVFNGVKA